VCIVVYGNRAYEDALRELKDITVKNGCIPVACAAFIGEHSFSNSETPIAAARPDIDDLSRAELLGKKIEEKLLSMSLINHFDDIIVPGNFPYKEVSPLPPDDFFAVDDNCSQGGICVQECPVGAIDSENIKSIDANKCICCCACIKKCPASARTIKSVMLKKIALQLSQKCLDRKEPVFFL
jgi:ferredoxin